MGWKGASKCWVLLCCGRACCALYAMCVLDSKLRASELGEEDDPGGFSRELRDRDLCVRLETEPARWRVL